MSFSAEKSAVRAAGSSVMNSISVGTRSALSILCSTMVRSRTSGTGSRTMTTVDPVCIAQIAQIVPPIWNNGRQTSDRPPSRISLFSSAPQEPTLSKFQPVSIAPLGRPVVPEVQNWQLTAPSASRIGSLPPRGRSSKVMVGTPEAAPCALNSGPVTISFGLTSSMICFTSCGVSRQLIGAATTPALSSAKNNSK